MITAFLTGNFGNNLAGIISSKCIAKDLGYEWGVDPSPKYDYHNGAIQTDFLDIDYGHFPHNIKNDYEEKIVRYNHLGDSVDIRVFDDNVYNISDNTRLLGGVWQSPDYYWKHLSDIKYWLTYKKDFEKLAIETLEKNNIILDENTCVINFRGGEYSNYSSLILHPNYYQNAIKEMKKLNPNMNFLIVSDDPTTASRFIPGHRIVHFSIGIDYYIINKSKYLILSNSSFPIFSALTNENLIKLIAPKYWARHNVSNGYWAIGDQYYPGWSYMNREGFLETYEEVKKQAEQWRKENGV